MDQPAGRPLDAVVIDAVFVDAGGVLVLPDRHRIADRFAAEGLQIDPGRCAEAHYLGVAALDAAEADPEVFGDYHAAYAAHLGVADDARAATVLADLWAQTGLWTEPIPGAASALAALARLAPVVIVSNADGTVATLLAGLDLVQVGPGRGVEVAGIIDSGVVGVAKPDPRIFELALDLVGAAPDRAVHIGDARQYDVRGARAAGIRPLLVDPFDCRGDVDCERVTDLGAAAALLAAPT